MIQIIEGPSGSGKSYQLYTRMIEQSIREPERQFFLIVPEQSTMQAQRDVVMMHPRHGTMNIDIVSFNRLAYRVFEEQNLACDHVLEDFGKSMLLKKILLQHRTELKIFGPNVARDGFIDELKSLFTELFQYRITEERLEEVIRNTGQEATAGTGLLLQKLKELLFVYRRFREEIEGKYILAEHILEMLAQCVPRSELLHGSVLFLDGYTGFTPIQYDLLQALAMQVSSMTYTVTIDRISAEKDSLAEHELFYLSKDTIGRIKQLADRLDLYVEEEFLDGALPRFSNAPKLAFLEENLFRYPYRIWNQEILKTTPAPDSCMNNIQILAMKNTRQELQIVARQIHAMVREGKYRYRDIAIIHGDLQELAPVAEEILPQLNIPYFIDMNQNMYMNPCMESLRALLGIAEQDYTYDSVFRFLKTGVLEALSLNETPDEETCFMDSCPNPYMNLYTNRIEALENYCRKKGIRGLSWWKRAFSDEKLKSLVEGSPEWQIVAYGKKILEWLQTYTNALNAADTVKEYTDLIRKYMDQVDMQGLLNRNVIHFEEEGNYVQAKAYSQIYDKLTEILDKLTGILGEAHIDLTEYHCLLDTGLNDMALGVIPPSLDQLVIGDIERTRLNHVKVLYVMGLNDGIIPKVSRGAGILSEADRSVLSNKLELAPDSRQQVFTEQFYIYQNMTKPSDCLYLTYHLQNQEGNEMLPTYLISRIRKIFPELGIQYPDPDVLDWSMIETEQDSRGLLVAGLHRSDQDGDLSRQEGSIWKSLYLYYQRELPDILSRLKEGVSYHNIGQMLTPETAARLYGDFMNTSVSKLETYSRCPYQFFLEYGLHLRKREDHEVTLSEMGTLLHGVVEQVFRRVETRNAEGDSIMAKESVNPWAQITEEELQRLTMEAIDRIADSEQGEIYHQTAANRNLLQRMRQVAAYAVVDLKDQLMKGKMIPYRFELSFNRRLFHQKDLDEDCQNLDSATIALDQGKTMKLNGIIDRIDICQDDSHVYVKVLDYKSSQKELQMTEISAGLQLQLLIYTNVVMEVLKRRFPGKEIIPTGSLYYGFKLPMIEKKVKEEITLKNLRKATAMTGIVNSDEACMSYMGDSDILPNQGETMEEYKELLDEVQNTAKELGEEILHGEIPIRPVRSGRYTPCIYCDYKDVCKLDVKDGGNRIITAKQLQEQRNRKGK